MKTKISHQLPSKKVIVTTSARLHMGFFDLNGGVGRMFGSLGLALDAPDTSIEIVKSEKLLIDTKSNENVVKIVENLVKNLKLDVNFTLKVLEAVPQHVGLGSGTQMALAIGAGLNQLFNLNLTVSQIATAALRGRRSGIGIGAFEQGGFLIDSGKVDDELPEIALRHAFPNDWRVLLVTDSTHTGVHGAAELQAFQTLKPAQSSLQRMVFENMVPSLQRTDLLAFGAYMADLQAYNGDYFAPIQGGRYASRDVAEILAWLQANGAACVGQSSWGPTGFAILESKQEAEAMLANARLAFSIKSNICFQCCHGKNRGATIESYQ